MSNKDGIFIEKPSLLDKFERKNVKRNEHINKLTYTQFSMKYQSTNIEPSPTDFNSNQFERNQDGWNLTHSLDLIITHDFDDLDFHYSLPNYIEITNLKPGEPRYMKKRKRQVVRFHKENKTKNPHEFYFSQLQMYRPFTTENELEPDDLERCIKLYDEISPHNDCRKIENVQKLLLKHIKSVEIGTEKAEELINSRVGDIMDPELEQDNDDCQDAGMSEHQDFVFKNPEDLEQTNPGNKRYKQIELSDEKTMDKMAQNLDEDQRMVLEIGVHFAKSLVKAKKNRDMIVNPPLLVVQGGAGTGKSTVIDILTQQIEKILRTSGDNPDNPYIIKTAFTGTAAANIKGQTLHNAFSFSFGNEFFSLGDKARDERRIQLENLKVVTIDEFSMIKADMLYQLDLRLREVKQQADLYFGGVSVFLFGDILQLRPVKARYIFEEPKSETFNIAYLLDSLWDKFDVIVLKHNHRQGEDKEYANVLNRIRVGELADEDIRLLETRVRPVNHPDIPASALVITCMNKEVNEINNNRLDLIELPEHLIESVNKTNTNKTFTPKTDASGAISGTPLQRKLKLKVSAKVVLTHNLDTSDCLTNGAFGEILGFKFNQNRSIQTVFVHFYDKDIGKERRKNCTEIQKMFPGKNVTPIELLEFSYSLSRKKNNTSSSAIAIQFPLKLAFAATSHKIQGQTVKKPNNLVVDLRTVREPAQAYVILSRVQALSQLFILDSVCPKKIFASTEAMEELNKMAKKADKYTKKMNNSIISCNIRSIQKNLQNFTSTSAFKKAGVICLQETWLNPLFPATYFLVGWQQHVNSVGRGKGIITFYQHGYSWDEDITNENYQMSKIKSETQDIINVYRSANANNNNFIEDLKHLININKDVLILGDFNICYKSQYQNKIFGELRGIGFQQLVQIPTHTEGGLIDLIFFYSTDRKSVPSAIQQSQFFTDHGP